MSARIHKEKNRVNAPFLGCIADDFTGATDLAGVLVLNGMRAIVTFDPQCVQRPIYADAVVVALKSRSIPAKEAVAMSVTALRWLHSLGCRQFFFKYCSTFDSTPKGNIGPVTEALMEELDTDFTIACPAFPANNRTIYNGYLFVNRTLLEESGMRSHPLNPMTDSSLVRLLQAQAKRKVGLIAYPTVQEGVASIASAISEARRQRISLAIVDAISETHLSDIATACQDLPLITGASGIAMGIPKLLQSQGVLKTDLDASRLPDVPGLSAIISGSCSEATLRQVVWAEQHMPTFHLDPSQALRGSNLGRDVERWASSAMGKGPVLISSTARVDSVRKVQKKLGVEKAGKLVEDLLADIAKRLVDLGVRKLILAGGETSGAVLQMLRVHSLQIGPQIDPGVHWAASIGNPRLLLALKSGNFGGDHMFTEAWGAIKKASSSGHKV